MSKTETSNKPEYELEYLYEDWEEFYEKEKRRAAYSKKRKNDNRRSC